MSGRLRCAIYTRKSTEEGLEQSFNSLDAQREACEAYVLSQAGEGWACLPDLYDDGGWSGGNMDRPALKRLLGDIAKGRIDVVVVYKVDRLTRSLMDFARIVETFDANSVSFVSVTQAFNTTSSMGRLTLNVLLSFAQFEREVTGERIRDKIAASKARGMWMGGMVPLGYDLGDRQLVINPAEAETVRHIYRRYLDLRSLPALAKDLAAHGIHTKRWSSRRGITHGGIAFNCSGLSLILNSRLYLGEIVHRGKAYPGDHEAIIDEALFAAVQARLAANRHRRTTRKTRAATCPLTGRLFDADGQPMRPSFSYGRGKRMYRYYVSECLLPNGAVSGAGNRQGQRLPAGRIEKAILDRLGVLAAEPMEPDALLATVTKVVARGEQLRLTVTPAPYLAEGTCDDMLLGRVQQHLDPRATMEGGVLRITLPIPPARRGRSVPAGTGQRDPQASADLAALVRTGHRRLAGIDASPLQPERHAHMRAPPSDWIRARVAVALLAPDIQKALLQGTAPDGMDPDRLIAGDIPLDWDAQRRMFGMVD